MSSPDKICTIYNRLSWTKKECDQTDQVPMLKAILYTNFASNKIQRPNIFMQRSAHYLRSTIIFAYQYVLLKSFIRAICNPHQTIFSSPVGAVDRKPDISSMNMACKTVVWIQPTILIGLDGHLQPQSSHQMHHWGPQPYSGQIGGFGRGASTDKPKTVSCQAISREWWHDVSPDMSAHAIHAWVLRLVGRVWNV